MSVSTASQMDLILIFFGVIVLAVVVHIVPYLHDEHGLRVYPGPFFAKFSDAWYGVVAVMGHRAEVVYGLHQKHGKFVRLAPNHLSIADPDAVQIVYGHGSGTLKTDFYDPFVSIHPGLFSTRSRTEHTRKRKLVSNVFSHKNIVAFEPNVRDNVTLLMKQWDRLCEAGLADLRGDEGDGGWQGRDGRVWLDCMAWLNYLAFDTIGDLVFGAPFGMLESCKDSAPVAVSQETTMGSYGQGKDADVEYCHAIKILHGRGEYSAAIGILPIHWRPFVKKLPWFAERSHDVDRLAGIAVAAVNRRLNTETDRMDLLTKLCEASDDEGNRMDAGELTAEALTQMTAGSDTTANTSGAIMYYLARYPNVQEKLRREIEEASASDDNPVVSYEVIKNLPYLDAVLNEVLRFHSTSGSGLPRYVPKGGLTVCGRAFPAGTVLSVPLLTIHHDPAFWGPDAHVFRPERWFERDKETLHKAFFPFSWGPRSCIGRNLVMMEMAVIISSLVKRYEFVLEQPDAAMETKEGFIRKPVACRMGIKRRVI